MRRSLNVEAPEMSNTTTSPTAQLVNEDEKEDLELAFTPGGVEVNYSLRFFNISPLLCCRFRAVT